MDNIQSIKYLLSAKKDEQWGITINTVGTQTIEKDYVSYPPAEKHPEGFWTVGNCFTSIPGKVRCMMKKAMSHR